MAPYRHVSGKDETQKLMVDLVYGELELPEAPAGWRETLRALGLRTRALMLKHRWLAQLPPQAMFALTPQRLAVAERALASVAGTGLDADLMMTAFQAVSSYVQGATQADIALQSLMAQEGWAGGHDVRAGFALEMTWLLGTGRYPTYGRYVQEAARKDDPQWRFENGLDCVLNGIAAQLGC